MTKPKPKPKGKRRRRRPPPRVPPGTLTARRARFVAEYLIDLNASAAYRRAGFAAKDADVAGPRLLGSVGIAAAVAAGKAAQLAQAEITAVRVLQEVGRIAFVNGRDYWTPAGDAKHPKDLTVDQGAALAGFEVLIKNAKAGDNVTDTVHKFRLWDKVKALELLMRHLRLLDDHIEIVDPGARVARLEAARARLAARKGEAS